MNYKVFYRKYRPQSFETIVGQPYIVQTLQNSIKNGSISHAYIFSGPRGTGKTSTAKIFAKALNCLNPINGSPCGECDSCKLNNENPDIIELDAASNNGVDEIRNIIDTINLTPSYGKYKIYIIDEVHMMTVNAFNALLLTLEEPPSHVIFIMATTNIENVPVTILSRAQRFDFKKIDDIAISQSLKDVCLKENIDIEEDALNEIALLSDGGMRDALSTLDQLSKSGNKITLDLIEKEIKTVSNKTINDLIKSIETGDFESIEVILDDLSNNGTDYKNFCKKLIDKLSNMAISNYKNKSKFSISNVKELIFDLLESENKVNINVNPFTILKIILIKYMPKNLNSNIDKVQTNDNGYIEEKIEKENIVNEIKIDNDKLKSIRINNCLAEASKSDKELIKADFQKLIDVSNIDGVLKSVLMDCEICASSKKYSILGLTNEHEVTLMNNKLLDFDKSLKSNNREYKLVFVSNREWTQIKEKYVSDLKNGIKYQFIAEPEQSETVINSVFDISKVEIV